MSMSSQASSATLNMLAVAQAAFSVSLTLYLQRSRSDVNLIAFAPSEIPGAAN